MSISKYTRDNIQKGSTRVGKVKYEVEDKITCMRWDANY